jgi:hypothetical protein
MSIVAAGFDVHRSQIPFIALDTRTGEVMRGRIEASSQAVIGVGPSLPRRRGAGDARGLHRLVLPRRSKLEARWLTSEIPPRRGPGAVLSARKDRSRGRPLASNPAVGGSPMRKSAIRARQPC